MVDVKLLKKLEFSGISSAFTRLIGKGEQTKELDNIFSLAKENNINPFMFSGDSENAYFNEVAKKIISGIKKSGNVNFYEYLKANGFSLFNNVSMSYSKKEEISERKRPYFPYLQHLLKVENINDIKKVGELYSKNIYKDFYSEPYSSEFSHLLRMTISQTDAINEAYNKRANLIQKSTKAEIDDFIKKAIIAEKIKDNFFDMDFSYIKKLPAETVAQHFKYYNDNNKVQDFNEDDIHRILFKYILESSDVFNKFSSNKFSSFLIKSGLSIEQFNREIFSPRILFASSTGQSFFNPSYIKLYNDSHDLKIYYANENISEEVRESYIKSLVSYNINEHLEKVLSDMKDCGFMFNEKDLVHVLPHSGKNEKLNKIKNIFMSDRTDFEILHTMLETMITPEYTAKKNIMRFSLFDNFNIKDFSQDEYNRTLFLLKNAKETNGFISPFIKNQLKFLYNNELLRDNKESLNWMKENRFNPFTVYPDIIFESKTKPYFNDGVLYDSDLQFNRKNHSLFLRYVNDVNAPVNSQELRYYTHLIDFIMSNNIDPYKIISESKDKNFAHERIFEDMLNVLVLADIASEKKEIVPSKFLTWLDYCSTYTAPENYLEGLHFDSISNVIFRNVIDKFILNESLKNFQVKPENKTKNRL